jgi:hypothetical protein
MASLAEIQKRNDELAHQINREALANSHLPYAGKFVSIANGQIAAVADTLDDAISQLHQAGPDSARTCCIEAGRDYSVPEYIWELA